MIVVGYVCGGEAEAVLKVAQFEEARRESVRKALRCALMANGQGMGGEADDASTLHAELSVSGQHVGTHS